VRRGTRAAYPSAVTRRLLARVSLALATGLAGACAGAPAEPGLVRYEFERPAMGTLFRLVLYAPDEPAARAAAEEAFARIRALDGSLSDYDPESELSRLGALSDDGPAGPVPVSDDLGRVLALSQQLARASDGAFDVTVGPLVRLWRRARRQDELPGEERLAAASAAVGFRKLELGDDGRVSLRARGMRLDLGGIAKGFALDEAVRVLRRRGLECVLVDGGGDLRVGAAPPGRAGWRIALVRGEAGGGPDLRESQDGLLLADAAVATSGDLERFFELGGRRYSHILDPRTGRALEERRLVSVVVPAAAAGTGDPGALADGLATAVSVLGPELGLRLVARYPGVSARVQAVGPSEAGDAGRVFSSAGFPLGLFCPTPSTP